SFTADDVHGILCRWEKFVARRLCIFRHKTVRMGSDGERIRIVSMLFQCPFVQVDKRLETKRTAADDRQNERQTEFSGADDRIGGAAAGNPHRQWILHRTWIDAPAVDRRPMFPFPSDDSLL